MLNQTTASYQVGGSFWLAPKDEQTHVHKETTSQDIENFNKCVNGISKEPLGTGWISWMNVNFIEKARKEKIVII